MPSFFTPAEGLNEGSIALLRGSNELALSAFAPGVAVPCFDESERAVGPSDGEGPAHVGPTPSQEGTRG